jgi:hypothetical protein
MDFDEISKEHDQLIDAAEIDPARPLNLESRRIAKTDWRAHIKTGARRAAQRAFADVPDPVTISMLPSRLVPFAHRIVEAIKHGKLDQIDTLLYSFWAELSCLVLKERQDGILAPITPESEIKPCRGMLAAKKRNSNEVAGLRAVLRDGERIRHVGFRQIQTSERVITREEEWAAMPHDRCVSAAEREEEKDREAQLRGPGSDAFIY